MDDKDKKALKTLVNKESADSSKAQTASDKYAQRKEMQDKEMQGNTNANAPESLIEANTPPTNQRNSSQPTSRRTAVAIKGPRLSSSPSSSGSSSSSSASNTPSATGLKTSATQIIASGRGKIAEEIMELAFENGVRVREDKDLAELLAYLDIDTPIPSEALEAVAEILSYVYQANGQPNPFDAILKDVMDEEDNTEDIPQ